MHHPASAHIQLLHFLIGAAAHTAAPSHTRLPLSHHTTVESGEHVCVQAAHREHRRRFRRADRQADGQHQREGLHPGVASTVKTASTGTPSDLTTHTSRQYAHKRQQRHSVSHVSLDTAFNWDVTSLGSRTSLKMQANSKHGQASPAQCHEQLWQLQGEAPWWAPSMAMLHLLNVISSCGKCGMRRIVGPTCRTYAAQRPAMSQLLHHAERDGGKCSAKRTMGPHRSQLRSAALCWSRDLNGNTTRMRLSPMRCRSRFTVAHTGSSSVFSGALPNPLAAPPAPPPPPPLAPLPPGAVGDSGACACVEVGTEGAPWNNCTHTGLF